MGESASFSLKGASNCAGELLLEPRQSQPRRRDEEKRVLRRANDLRHLRRMLGENVVHRGLNVGGVEKRDGGVGLRVEIDQKRFFFLKSECGSQIDGSSGLSDAALLIGN